MPNYRFENVNFFRKLTNGSSYSPTYGTETFVKANVLEPCRLEFDVVIDLGFSVQEGAKLIQFDDYEAFIDVENIDLQAEGVEVGSYLYLIENESPTVTFIDLYVASIEGNRIYLASNPLLTFGEKPINKIAFPIINAGAEPNDFVELSLSMNFLPQDEPFTSLSPYTNTSQTYFFKNVSKTPSGTVYNGEPVGGGKKAWDFFENVDMQFFNTVKSVNTAEYQSKGFDVSYGRRYSFWVDFICNPFYLEGQIENIQNNTKPTLFLGADCPQFSFEVTAFTKKNYESKIKYNTQIRSAIGWFNEVYNGGENFITSVSNFAILEGATPVSRLTANNPCTVSFLLNSVGKFSLHTGVRFGFIRLTDFYTSSPNTWTDVFALNDIQAKANMASPISGGLFSYYFLNYVDANIIGVSAVFDLTSLNLANDEEYLLFCHVSTDTEQPTSALNSQCVNLILQQNKLYVNPDIEGLLTLDYLSVYDQSVKFVEYTGINAETWDGGGYTHNVRACNESELMANVQFNIPYSAIDVLQFGTVTAKLIAQNGTNEFAIQNIPISFEQIISNYRARIESRNTRGYLMSDLDQANLLNFYYFIKVGSDLFYRAQIGFKINWQEWLSLPNADTIFYNKNKQLNGLNQKTSNYSLKNGYAINFVLDVEVIKGSQPTIYRLQTPSIEVADYETDHTTIAPYWSTAYIKTYDENGNDLNGVIQTDKNTIVKGFAVPLVALTDAFTMRGIIRIEAQNQSGFAQYVCSTQEQTITDNVLQGIFNGYAKKYIQSGNLVIESLIDYTKLDIDTQYSLSFEVSNKDADAFTGAYSTGYNKLSYN